MGHVRPLHPGSLHRPKLRNAILAAIAAVPLLVAPAGLRSEGYEAQPGNARAPESQPDSQPDSQNVEAELATAWRLAALLRAARIVISQHQDLINDPARGDKGLTGERVIGESIVAYRRMTGEDPREMPPGSDDARFLQAQMDAIREIVDEQQETINAPGVGFKGLIPAVFARLVNERFAERMGDEALVKVTAPEPLVRNRTARPDVWEATILDRFAQPAWPKGEPFSEVVDVEGRPAFRLLVPEYYNASCLTCHGKPAGEMDITGYPKEGGAEGDLGAAISVTLFQ